MMVEELLELLVTEIDANLLEGVKFEDLKTGNIQNSNEIDFLHGRVNQRAVTQVNKPHKQSIVH